VETSPGVWTGTVLHVDHFGNIVTNFTNNLSAELVNGRFEVTLGEYRIYQFHKDYSSSRAGELFLIEGSSGYLEVSARQAHAASRVGIALSHAITLHLTLPE
jgi:S-adenosylmethionine hydrolase